MAGSDVGALLCEGIPEGRAALMLSAAFEAASCMAAGEGRGDEVSPCMAISA